MAVTSMLSRFFKKFRNSFVGQTAHLQRDERERLALAIRSLGPEQPLSQSNASVETVVPSDELACVRQQISQQSLKTAAVGQREIIDQEMIHQICQYDDGTHGDTLTEIIRLFLELTPKRIENLKRALEERNWHCVSKEAHSLKSSSANLGLKKVTAACRKLEAIENHPDYPMAHAVLSEIEKEYQSASRSLVELVQRRVPVRKVAA